MSVYIMIGIIFLVIVFTYAYIKAGKDVDAGKNSEEKRAIDRLIGTLAPDGQYMTAAYATWEFTEWQGGTKYTDFWYYAIGFSDDMLMVIPLSFDDGGMSYGKPVTFSKENIKIVNSDETALIPWVELYDKEGECVISLMVRGSNTKEDRFHPVNIQQQDVVQRFILWRDAWMYEVNERNGIKVSGNQGNP